MEDVVHAAVEVEELAEDAKEPEVELRRLSSRVSEIDHVFDV